MRARKAGRYFTVGETTYAPGETVPADVVALVDNPAVWTTPDGELTEEVDESTKGYADLKVDELKAAIEARNEGRQDDQKLSTEGKKADLVAALEADDAASSGA